MKTSKTMKEFFDDFIIAKKAQGLADKTIKSYQSQFRAINNHLDVNVPIEDITKSDLEKWLQVCVIQILPQIPLVPMYAF